ncbi:hypothetical protein ABZW30_13340 [Kitasatospora sp. NPDC004669]|uniref:hypothetical protein n=1 Tax=Kitasatospora sp. NPDC004669 TaxID=3154555 RepID=UPI0033A29B3C
MPETAAATLLAEVYTWYSTGLRDLVQEKLDDAGLDTANDLIDDLCGELWLHAAELAVSHGRSFTELLDTLDVNAEIFVNRLYHRPAVTLGGCLDAAADSIDVAEHASNAVDGTGYRPAPRPQRPVATSLVFEHLAVLRSAA